MRTMQTYILRLLVDTETPRAIRGVIRAVEDDAEQAFDDGLALLALLCEMSDRNDQTASAQDDAAATDLERRRYDDEDERDA